MTAQELIDEIKGGIRDGKYTDSDRFEYKVYHKPQDIQKAAQKLKDLIISSFFEDRILETTIYNMPKLYHCFPKEIIEIITTAYRMYCNNEDKYMDKFSYGICRCIRRLGPLSNDDEENLHNIIEKTIEIDNYYCRDVVIDVCEEWRSTWCIDFLTRKYDLFSNNMKKYVDKLIDEFKQEIEKHSLYDIKR